MMYEKLICLVLVGIVAAAVQVVTFFKTNR